MNTLFAVFLFLIPIFLLHTRRKKSSERLPPGSLGLPLIGQSLGLLRAMRANTAEKWLEQRIKKYGPVSKLSLFGKPTVFIHGQAANKFVFTANGSTISSKQTESIRRILGERSLFELSAEDHKRVRSALMLFLKPESLKQYVEKMDEEIRNHLEMHWHGKQQVTVLPLMKNLTFNIICSLLFGLERGTRRDEFVECFQTMMEGMWSVPVNLPFTRYNSSLKASKRVQNMLKELIREKRVQLEQRKASPQQDLVTCFLSIRNDEGKEELTELEMVHNVMVVMVAGHDTSSILITFLLRLLANEPAVYAHLLQEQEEIARSKSAGEFLTWEDLAKMKYTWRVAQETLRVTPPIFGSFRTAMKDIEFGGYLIPKGWQIFWAAHMTHMNDSIFPEPSKFDPSRFEKQVLPPYCFVGFGGGPRICPGYEFARIETLIAMHHMVTRFTWKLTADDQFSRDPMPVPTQGLPLEIMPRTRL
ncbi:PREDICTED: cytochrome P450 716B1-like [Fragaria vesca subsp. vesca]|uniref:cytochrome P450 716B1-like n=1 Tax=Fragaria vesca subsp. vesca TaxID=101020 RepID=UPI0002C32A84|nr:PREDICTED: cytochrome P450 716B1-like [Fragaria vesca subsp. vesca]